MGTATRAVDIDTGGGEFLGRMAPFPGFVVATEGHAPNVPIAAELLAPLGVPVVEAQSAPDNVEQGEPRDRSTSSPFPFASEAFDLVVDRHSSYWPSEVFRVLRSGGHFLTQQRSEAGATGEVWGDVFGRPPHPHRRFDLEFAVGQLRTVGFEILRAEEADTPMAFQDVGAIIYYLRLVPWAVGGFDPVGDRSRLEEIHTRIAAHGEVLIRGSHMLIESIKT
jgi:SAM-dependent methyltransferase